MKYLITLLCCLSAFAGRSQTLELNQLKSFIGKPVLKIADSLEKRGWAFHAELSGTKEHQSYKTLSYGKLKSEKGKALSWFRVHADNGIINQLYYQTPGYAQYDVLLKEILLLTPEKKEEQSIEDKKLSTYYVTPDFIFQTVTGATYTIMVMANAAR